MITLDVLYAKICGNGTEHPRTWTTFTCFRIARNLEDIWSKIKLAREANILDEHLISEWTAADLGEDNMVLFSKAHLKYSFSKAFKEWECNGQENQVPIVWFTRPSSLKVSIGSYCVCSISNHRIRGVAPPNEEISHGLLTTKCDFTRDGFWRSVNSAGTGIGISYLILYRLLAYFVIENHNSGETKAPSKTNLVTHMEYVPLGDYRLHLLFTPRLGAIDYVHNHVCKTVKSNLVFYDHTSPNGYVNLNRGSLQRSTLSLTNRAFRTMLPQQLRELLIRRTTRDTRVPTEQITFPFYDRDTPQVAHLNTLTGQPGFRNFSGTLQYACQHGILTESMLVKLLEFRLQFNINREKFQRGVLENPNYGLSGLNTTLLRKAGFGCDAPMTLKPAKT